MTRADAADAPALLVVDDEPQVLALVPQLFRDDFPVVSAPDGPTALARLAECEVGVVIADQRMPGMSGTELLARVARDHPDAGRILLTAYADVDNLLEAINVGHVHQFVTKPWDNRELAVIGRRAMETYRLRVHNAHLLEENSRLVAQLRGVNERLESENRTLRREVGDRNRLGDILGASAAMQDAMRLIEKAAQSTATVLVTGETGTGKELAAAAIHYNGARREQRFVTVNCGALPESLLESELFGHVKGAFTGALRDRRGVFEDATGGTIFLDEIGEMSPAMQAKVLRVVEDGLVRRVGATDTVRVDVRLVCATNRDLAAEVEAGRFRRDLYYRVNVFPIRLPALRDRAGDLAHLAEHFLARFDEETGKRLRGFTPAALRALERHVWPGNVRELRNEIERGVALAEPEDAIDVGHLSAAVTGDAAVASLDGGDGGLRERLDRIEETLILQELRRHGNNRTHTARHLGISVRALQKKIGKFRLADED